MRICLVMLFACTPALAGKPSQTVELPAGKPGIGFDDLQYSSRLGRVLVPAGRSGNLDLIDPATGKVATTIGGFSSAKAFDGGHDFGITSVADTGSALAVTDRSSDEIVLVDGTKITARHKLAGGPDYVRWVPATKELWVTEPDADQIEVFSADLKPVATIAVKGGPESLAIAGTTAYTHLWAGATVEIDVARRAIATTYKNGCGGSRGIAVDEANGLVFAGCADGKVTVLAKGKVIAQLRPVDGMDIIAWSPAKRHLYLAGSSSADLAIVAVGKDGALKLLGKAAGAKGGHCVTTDDAGHAYVCDPRGGRLLVDADPY
jgi:DNA-binding beta-propeller fold protein YncE